jgi:hypothetical protein
MIGGIEAGLCAKTSESVGPRPAMEPSGLRGDGVMPAAARGVRGFDLIGVVAPRSCFIQTNGQG